MIPSVYSVSDALTLRVCKTEKFKAGMLSLSAVLPLCAETTWKTSLLLSVLKRGTEKYPTLEAINRRLDYLYGTDLAIRNFYRGDSQVIGFSADFLEGAYLPEGENLLHDILDVVCQILFHPVTDENGLLLAHYIESEKQVQCDAIRALKNNPRAYASDHFRTIMYEDDPYAVSLSGEEEEILSITPEELTAHWHSFIDQLSLDCFYVGAMDAETVEQALADTVARKFGETARLIETPTPCRVVYRANSVRRVEETLAVSQSQLLLGFRTGCAIHDPDYYACVVFNELLGASPMSKLFMNVRERLSLCYRCASSYHARKGTVTVSCGLSALNRACAEEEILRQVKAIADGDFDDSELLGAKKSLLNAYRQAEDSPSALESIYFGRALAGVSDSLEEGRRKISEVTRESVIRVARGVSLDTVYFLEGTLGEGEDDDEND